MDKVKRFFVLCASWAALATFGGYGGDWGAYWLAWIFAGFLIPEVVLIAEHVRYGPLSDNVWRWEHLDAAHPFNFSQWTPMHWALALLVWFLFGWLSIHLPFGLARKLW